MTCISIMRLTHHCPQTAHMIGHHSPFRVGATFPGMLSGFTHAHVKTLQRKLDLFCVEEKPVSPRLYLSATLTCSSIAVFVYRLVAEPCAHLLQIQAAVPRQAQPNDVLEKVYQSKTVPLLASTYAHTSTMWMHFNISSSLVSG